jgi:hypothetical protein
MKKEWLVMLDQVRKILPQKTGMEKKALEDKIEKFNKYFGVK